MDSYSLNINGRKKGSLFQQKVLPPLAGFVPLLSVTNSSPHTKYQHNIGFARIAVNMSGSRIAAGDCQGRIYLFDFSENRFRFVCHLDRCSSALAFTPNRGKDLIVASSDCTISFVDSDSSQVIRSTHGHKTSVNHISVDASGNKAVTSSLDSATVWDLHTLTVVHKFAVKKSIDILKVFFLPLTNILVSAFKNNSVFLWDSVSLKCITNFTCDETNDSWLRTVDGSKDGQLIVCGGKKNYLSVWSVQKKSFLHNISLWDYPITVKQVMFLSVRIKESNHVLSVLSSEGKLHFYNIDLAEELHSLTSEMWNILSSTESCGILTLITSLGDIKLYNIESTFRKRKKPQSEKHSVPGVPFISADGKSRNQVHGKEKRKKKCKKDYGEILGDQLKSVLSVHGEYPAKYRSFVWSHLLKLPSNEEWIVFYESNGSSSEFKGCFGNPSLQRSFSRLLAMLMKWCPLLKEVDYVPFLVFPFVKVLHKNRQLCFELLISFICNWCQNWFLYLPFAPFNILCVVENLLLYHDRTLLHHFLLKDISPEIYAFNLMNTSFSDVFTRDQWLKLWDNIFSNSPSYLVFVAVAFSITSREVLLHCETREEIKLFFSRHSALASNIIEVASVLQQTTPACFNPLPVVGSFRPLPKGGYPVFHRFAPADVNLQTLSRQAALDTEVEHLRQKKAKLEIETLNYCRGNQLSEAGQEIQKNNLLELKRLQELKRSLVLQSAQEKQIDGLQKIEEKLKRIQNLIQDNLIEQAAVFEYEFKKSEEVQEQIKLELAFPEEGKNEVEARSAEDIQLSRNESFLESAAYCQAVKNSLNLREQLLKTGI